MFAKELETTTLLNTGRDSRTGAFSGFNEAEVVRGAERLAGAHWRLLYPRIYATAPQGFCSPKLPAAMLLGSALEPVEKHPFDLPVSKKLIQYSMPMMWLSKPLAEAMRNTAPPQEYDLLDLKLPLPAMTVLLPKGTIVSKDGAETRFFSFARYEAEEISDKVSEPHLFLLSGADDFTLQTLSISRRTSKINLADPSAFLDKLFSVGVNLDDSGKGVDEHRNKQVLFYFLSVVLALTARPELSEPARLERRVQHKGEVKEFWSPHVLGANYAVKHEMPQGEHASPRMHWVRGFWRNQAVGPRKTPEHRLTWIEPFLRGVV